MKLNRGFACVGLIGTKIEANVGGALRAAHCYGAGMVAIEGVRYKRISSDTTKAWRHIPLLETIDLFATLPYGCDPVGIEIIDGARSLEEFIHPERACYIFGPEDGSIPKRILDRCKYVVSIPTQYCMNLAATVNVVLYDRLVKQRGKAENAQRA